MQHNASPVLFADVLTTLPDIEHIAGLDICNAQGAVVRHIAAQPGKMGSLRVYHALAQRFDGQLNAEAIEQGLAWFAEHVADAQARPGAHPNIDFLLDARARAAHYTLHPLPVKD